MSSNFKEMAIANRNFLAYYVFSMFASSTNRIAFQVLESRFIELKEKSPIDFTWSQVISRV